MMHLALGLGSIGVHLAGWRHPDAWSDTVINWDQMLECTQMAERGKLDLVFLADGNAVRDMDNLDLFSAMVPEARPGGFEPITLLSSLASVTKNIGLVATTTTSFDEPYSVARRFASLDHISKGRAGWNVVTSSFEGDALNFSRDRHIIKAERYERAKEFVEVVFGLWKSWETDAFPEDKENGVYLSPEKVSTLNHVGKHFQICGPLNIARSPQERPLVFHAGQSEDGRDLAAYGADCVFAMTPTKELAQTYRRDMRNRAEAYGRSPDSIRLLPGATLYVGRDHSEADELFETLNELISPALGISRLSKLLSTDFSGLEADDMMPVLSENVIGASAVRAAVNRMVEAEPLTIAETYKRFLPTLGHPVFKGGPVEIADMIEDWYASGACDGLLLMPAVMPVVLKHFVDLVIPELQRRGIFRKEYAGSTLRETMRLPIGKR